MRAPASDGLSEARDRWEVLSFAAYLLAHWPAAEALPKVRAITAKTLASYEDAIEWARHRFEEDRDLFSGRRKKEVVAKPYEESSVERLAWLCFEDLKRLKRSGLEGFLTDYVAFILQIADADHLLGVAYDWIDGGTTIGEEKLAPPSDEELPPEARQHVLDVLESVRAALRKRRKPKLSVTAERNAVMREVADVLIVAGYAEQRTYDKRDEPLDDSLDESAASIITKALGRLGVVMREHTVEVALGTVPRRSVPN
jgi:hypothetical protein